MLPRILDRQRFRDFARAYVICFIALVGLYIVVDVFANIDEFTEIQDGTAGLLRRMGRFYLIRLSSFYDRLCGVIGMMAAIFTVTWMQKNNELLAMLAAGVSTRRVIRPVLIAAVVVSGLSVANQEYIMPQIGEELLRSADDDGSRPVKVYSRSDSNDIAFVGETGEPDTQTIVSFTASLPSSRFGALIDLHARQARYIPPDHPTAPLKGGWLLRGVRLAPDVPPDGRLLVWLCPEGDLPAYPPPSSRRSPAEAAGEAYFLATDVGFSDLTRHRQWYMTASTIDLIRALTDPASAPERHEIRVFLHGRLLRPLMALTLMGLSLPLVLGGEGRNMFVNLGLSLGTSAVVYSSMFLCSYLANNDVLGPELAAWLPLFVFGTLAVARWDTIRT